MTSPPRRRPWSLSVNDFQGVRSAAEASVNVPNSVDDLIVDLRAFLQDKCEPPVYVSDRRAGQVGVPPEGVRTPTGVKR